jgi:membrane-bound serine protease (ClpP class)
VRSLLVSVLVAVGVISVAAQAQEETRTVEVIELSGPFDTRLVTFAREAIVDAATRPVELVVLAIDSPGSLAPVDELARLVDAVASSPVPIVAWLGPAPGTTGGGALQLAVAAPLTAAAPGVELGEWSPSRAGDPSSADVEPVPAGHEPGMVVAGPVEGLVDVVQPSLRQLIQELDGKVVLVANEAVTLSTVRPFTAPDGSEGVTVLETIIRQPGWWERLLGLAVSPEAAYFFLVAGLVVAAFEYYAIGPGVAASVALASLLLAAYGMAVLPVRGWAVMVTVLAVGLLSASYQRGGVPVLTGLGLAVLVVAGLSFTDAAPQITPSPLGVAGTVLAAGFFFLLAMPTVARARFSTQTIGRDHLIGVEGRALVDLTPDGVVEVAGARWRASSHREAGIRDGDPVVVVAVDGEYLEVDRRY